MIFIVIVIEYKRVCVIQVKNKNVNKHKWRETSSSDIKFFITTANLCWITYEFVTILNDELFIPSLVIPWISGNHIFYDF